MKISSKWTEFCIISLKNINTVSRNFFQNKIRQNEKSFVNLECKQNFTIFSWLFWSSKIRQNERTSMYPECKQNHDFSWWVKSSKFHNFLVELNKIRQNERSFELCCLNVNKISRFFDFVKFVKMKFWRFFSIYLFSKSAAPLTNSRPMLGFILSSIIKMTIPRSSRPRRPARPDIWMYSPLDTHLMSFPSNFWALVKTTVRAGMFKPMAKVSVANKAEIVNVNKELKLKCKQTSAIER